MGTSATRRRISPGRTTNRRGIPAGLLAVVWALGLWQPLDPRLVFAAEPAAVETAASETTAATQAEPAKTTRPRKTGRLTTEVTTSGTMRVSVVDGEGHPRPGATVHVCQLMGESWLDADRPLETVFVTGAAGVADVEIPKRLSHLAMWAGSPGCASLAFAWEPARNGDLIPDAFTFRLPKGSSIGGVVRDELGQPVPGARVEVIYEHAWVAIGAGAKVTDVEGRWRLDDVPADNDCFSIKFFHPDFASDMVSGDMQLKQRITTAALRAQTATIVMPHGTRITGRVTDSDGNPLPGAVVVWGDDPLLERFPNQEVRTNEQGVYHLRPLANGPMRVTVIAQGWMPELRVVNVAADMPPVDFKLRPGKKLRIRFVDSSGAAVPDVVVRIDRWRESRSLYNHNVPGVLDTGVPERATDGVFEWTWPPDDQIWYEFSTPADAPYPLVGDYVNLAPGNKEIVQVMRPRQRVAGRVVDAQTGAPIEHVTVIPFGNEWASRTRARPCAGKRFDIDLQPGDHRLRIEADGYRTRLTDFFHRDKAVTLVNVQLEPAPLATGRVVDRDGKPVAGAKVLLATPTQLVEIFTDRIGSGHEDAAITDADGAFAFPAQFENYIVVATDDRGYAESPRLRPDQSPGEMKLAPWARVSGRLYQAGRPVGRSPVELIAIRPRNFYPFFNPARPQTSDELKGLRPRSFDPKIINPARPQSSFETQVSIDFGRYTDDDGRFAFERVPPMRYTLRGKFGLDWHGPVQSAESVPLDMKPGEQVTRDLGAGGAVIRGRVAAKGGFGGLLIREHGSQDWLAPHVDRDAVDAVPLAPGIGADFRDGGETALPPAGLHYLFQLHGDSRFSISGVPAGDYDLALLLDVKLQLGPIKPRTVRVRVTDADVARGERDVGVVEIAPADER